jgi:hypothetical protein
MGNLLLTKRCWTRFAPSTSSPQATIILLQLRIHTSVIWHVGLRTMKPVRSYSSTETVSHHRNYKFSSMNITFSNSECGGLCQHRVSLFTGIFEACPPYDIYDRKLCSKEDSNNTTHIATGRRNDRKLRFLGYYAASSGYFLPTFRDNLSVSLSGGLNSRPLKVGPISCSQKSLRDYHYSLRNNPEERSSRLLRDGRLKSRKKWLAYVSGHQLSFERITRRTLVRKDLMTVRSVILHPYASPFGMNRAVNF